MYFTVLGAALELYCLKEKEDEVILRAVTKSLCKHSMNWIFSFTLQIVQLVLSNMLPGVLPCLFKATFFLISDINP